MRQELYPKLTVRLYGEDRCFGPGIATLLERVARYHSLRAAARSMDMAYSKAWTILRRAESNLGFRLLETTVGGRGGGSAALTQEGERLLAAYRAYCRALERYGREIFEDYFPPQDAEKPPSK